MNPIKPHELTARAEAYRQLAKAYEADPSQELFLEQVKRDTEAAHRWLKTQCNSRPKF
jgi:hypothetical protein